MAEFAKCLFSYILRFEEYERDDVTVIFPFSPEAVAFTNGSTEYTLCTTFTTAAW